MKLYKIKNLFWNNASSKKPSNFTIDNQDLAVFVANKPYKIDLESKYIGKLKSDLDFNYVIDDNQKGYIATKIKPFNTKNNLWLYELEYDIWYNDIQNNSDVLVTYNKIRQKDLKVSEDKTLPLNVKIKTNEYTKHTNSLSTIIPFITTINDNTPYTFKDQEFFNVKGFFRNIEVVGLTGEYLEAILRGFREYKVLDVTIFNPEVVGEEFLGHTLNGKVAESSVESQKVIYIPNYNLNILEWQKSRVYKSFVLRGTENPNEAKTFALIPYWWSGAIDYKITNNPQVDSDIILNDTYYNLGPTYYLQISPLDNYQKGFAINRNIEIYRPLVTSGDTYRKVDRELFNMEIFRYKHVYGVLEHQQTKEKIFVEINGNQIIFHNQNNYITLNKFYNHWDYIYNSLQKVEIEETQKEFYKDKFISIVTKEKVLSFSLDFDILNSREKNKLQRDVHKILSDVIESSFKNNLLINKYNNVETLKKLQLDFERKNIITNTITNSVSTGLSATTSALLGGGNPLSIGASITQAAIGLGNNIYNAVQQISFSKEKYQLELLNNYIDKFNWYSSLNDKSYNLLPLIHNSNLTNVEWYIWTKDQIIDDALIFDNYDDSQWYKPIIKPGYYNFSNVYTTNISTKDLGLLTNVDINVISWQ